MHKSHLRVLIAGGGTGGHLFPAFAIAAALHRRVPHGDIHFVGSKYGMEAEQFRNRSEPHTLLNIRGFIRGLSAEAVLRNLLFPFRFIGAYGKSRSLLSRLQPHVVVGTGGYASGLPVLAATHKRIPTLIHEQNSYPGFTTRWLANRVDTVCLSYESSKDYLKKKTLLSRAIQYERSYLP